MTIDATGLLDKNLFVLFANQVLKHPGATAVIDATGATSYAALELRASRIAGALVHRGLHAEQPVGVLMHRTAELVATLLGILKAGGCYVPLDPDDPSERTRRILTGAGCELVLGHELLLDELRAILPTADDGASGVALVDVSRLDAEAASVHPRPPQPGPHDGRGLAYILFTSGSTGIPKGVEIEHRSVINLLVAARDLLGFSESDRYLATTTVGFDISVAELFLPLITGGIVVIEDRRLVMEPRRLAEAIRRHGVTVFQAVPSVWSVVLDEIRDFPRLRVAISTGEAIAPELSRRLVGIADAAWNLYGPTETTVWATGHRLDRTVPDPEVHSPVSAPIGQPFSNVEVRVLDEKHAPVSPGNQGELWIGGVALARGYRGDDELTRQRFVCLGEGQRFYRTGDIVAADSRGTLHYFGRNDDQIKVRGVRIEPMEVESAILGHPSVTQAAATWFETVSGSRSIVAAVVTKPGSVLTAEALQQHLSKLLPSAMVPARFLFCPVLPLSPSGKVDRKSIREQLTDAAAQTAPNPGREGVTDTELALIRIWERIIGVGTVSRTDHFFTIGGDSLSAVTMMLRVERAFDISLTVLDIYEAPTLDRLANRVDRKRPQPDTGTPATFIYPLTQQGSGPPVFFSSVDFKLARTGLWSPDCPLYAISLWAQGTGFVKASSVEELARSYIEGIRSIQPRGPYRLAGYSFGGLVALEIAQQLRSAGERIELLFLLDPIEPLTSGGGARKGSPGRAGERLDARIKRHARYLARHPKESVSYVGSRMRRLALAFVGVLDRGSRRPLWEWINYQIVHLVGRHPNAFSTRLLPKDRWPAFWHASKRLGGSYAAQPYEGDVLVVFAGREDRASVWGPLLGSNAESRFVASTHTELFSDPALSQWLEILRARLDGTQRRPAASAVANATVVDQ